MWAFDGDGALLMHQGSLAVIAEPRLAAVAGPLTFIRPQATKPVFHSSALTGGAPVPDVLSGALDPVVAGLEEGVLPRRAASSFSRALDRSSAACRAAASCRACSSAAS